MQKKCVRGGGNRKANKENEEGKRSMAAKEKTIATTESTRSKQSREVAIVETHPEGLQPYSTELKEAISEQKNLLSTHAHRLQNLIHSEVWALETEFVAATEPSEMNQRLSEQSRQSVLTMGHQLLETIKLGVAVAGVQMKIERNEL